MVNTWYVLNYKGNYVREVDENYSDTQCRVMSSPKIENAHLLSESMRKNWIVSFVMTIEDLEIKDLKSYKVEVESKIVNESETDTFAVRFKNENGKYVWLIGMTPDGLRATKEDMKESLAIDYADLNDRDTTDLIIKLFNKLKDVGMLGSQATDPEIVPIKRTFTNIEEI